MLCSELLFPDRALSAGRERPSLSPRGIDQPELTITVNSTERGEEPAAARGGHHADSRAGQAADLERGPEGFPLASPSPSYQHSEQRERVCPAQEPASAATWDTRPGLAVVIIALIMGQLPCMFCVFHGVLVIPHDMLRSSDFRITHTWI